MILQKKVVTKELSNGLTRALAKLATVLIWVKSYWLLVCRVADPY
jgi:hypothetical protein